MAFKAEAEVLASLRHANVVQYLAICEEPPLLVMEFLGRGSLYRVLHATGIALD